MTERTYGRLARQRVRFFVTEMFRGVQGGRQASRDRFDVTFDSGNLAREKDVGIHPELQSVRQQRGSIDIGVAVDLAVPEEFGVLKAGDQTHDSLLLAESQMILEAYEVVAIGS